MLIRKRSEELERKILCHRAALSANAVRDREEKKDPLRTDFQRDRDRILHSNSFRRLKHKTQVYIAPRGDHYRTRRKSAATLNTTSRASALWRNWKRKARD